MTNTERYSDGISVWNILSYICRLCSHLNYVVSAMLSRLCFESVKTLPYYFENLNSLNSKEAKNHERYW